LNLKRSAILAMPFLLLTLTGCSGTKDSSSNSSSSSKSSQDDSYDLPTSGAFTKAVNKAKNMDTLKRTTAEENDADIRYSDIVGSSNRDKYAGKAKIITGTVTGKKSTTAKDNYMYFVPDTANSKHAYWVYTNKKGIRTDDTLMVHGVIVGKVTYTNGNGNRRNGVIIAAAAKDIQNNGAVGK